MGIKFPPATILPLPSLCSLFDVVFLSKVLLDIKQLIGLPIAIYFQVYIFWSRSLL